jgi:hypothetical protein
MDLYHWALELDEESVQWVCPLSPSGQDNELQTGRLKLVENEARRVVGIALHLEAMKAAFQ